MNPVSNGFQARPAPHADAHVFAESRREYGGRLEGSLHLRVAASTGPRGQRRCLAPGCLAVARLRI